MHAMQQIASSGLQAIAKHETPAHAHVHAHALVSVFTDTSVESKRMAVVFGLAMGDGRITSGQLDEELAEACKMASEVDKASGFIAKADAKGSAKYGPKRNIMNTVASNIRQVWGGLALCNLGADRTADGMAIEPAIKSDTPFTHAYKLSQGALKAQGIKWDGRKLPTEAEKQAKAASAVVLEAQAAYAKEFPMQAGETIAEFQQRMMMASEVRAHDMAEKATEENIAKLSDSLWKQHGADFCAMLADALYAKFDSHAAEAAKAAAEAAVTSGEPDSSEEGETV